MAGNVIEEFVISITGTTKGLDKSLKSATEESDKFEKRLVKVEKTSSSLGKSFAASLSSARGFLSGLITTGAIASGVFSSIGRGAHFQQLSNVLGISAHDIDAWGRVVKNAGGSAESFYSGLQKITIGRNSDSGVRQALAVLGAGGEGGSTIDKVKQIADTLHTIYNPEQGASQSSQYNRLFGFASQFFDANTINLLSRQGSAGVSSLVANAGGISSGDAKSLNEFFQQLNNVENKVGGLFNKLGASVFKDPQIQRGIHLFENFLEYLTKNSQLVAGGLKVIGVAATIAFAPFSELLAIATGITTAFELIKNTNFSDFFKELASDKPPASAYGNDHVLDKLRAFSSSLAGSSSSSSSNATNNNNNITLNQHISGSNNGNPAQVQNGAQVGITNALNAAIFNNVR